MTLYWPGTFAGQDTVAQSAVRPPVITPAMANSGTYAIPHAAQGVTIDPGGSGNHLPRSYFLGGSSSAQSMPTGGSGLGVLGTPTEPQSSPGLQFVNDNWPWLLLALVIALFVVFVVL